MPLRKEDFDELQAFVRANLNEWLAEKSLSKPSVVYEIELGRTYGACRRRT